MKMVEVVWDDAHVDTGSISIRKAAKVRPIRTRTLAYLVAENDEGVVLAADIYPKMPKEAAIINFIPWPMVVEYWELQDVSEKNI